MRLIDADALLALMVETLESIKRFPKMDNQEAHLISAFHTVGLMIHNAPTIEPKRGKWLPHPDKTVTDHKICSVCGIGTRFRVHCCDKEQKWIEEDSYRYCPRCGAKMEVNNETD